jgi:predicted CXXCH cytochrome family protein
VYKRQGQNSQGIVLCLSCHRAHGSAHDDLLRWDYAGMQAGTTGAEAGSGCFICHTTKDGV